MGKLRLLIVLLGGGRLLLWTRHLHWLMRALYVLLGHCVIVLAGCAHNASRCLLAMHVCIPNVRCCKHAMGFPWNRAGSEHPLMALTAATGLSPLTGESPSGIARPCRFSKSRLYCQASTFATTVTATQKTYILNCATWRICTPLAPHDHCPVMAQWNKRISCGRVLPEPGCSPDGGLWYDMKFLSP